MSKQSLVEILGPALSGGAVAVAVHPPLPIEDDVELVFPKIRLEVGNGRISEGERPARVATARGVSGTIAGRDEDREMRDRRDSRRL